MPFEITMQQFLDCVLEARRREYFNFSNRIIEESNLWMYNYFTGDCLL